MPEVWGLGLGPKTLQPCQRFSQPDYLTEAAREAMIQGMGIDGLWQAALRMHLGSSAVSAGLVRLRLHASMLPMRGTGRHCHIEEATCRFSK